MSEQSTPLNDLLRGFEPPDFNGRNIVNLLSSLIHAGGGHSPHAELAVLPSDRLRGFRHLIYLVIDGLGEHQLEDYLKDHPTSPFFGWYGREEITTVFPATTASAVTTFATGASPAEHGVLSWHLHLHDLGTVATILVSRTRTGLPLIPEKADWRGYLGVPDHLASVPLRRHLLSYAHIPASPFSMATGSWDRRRGYRTLWGLRRSIGRVLWGRRPSLTYAYWPGYDSACHHAGCYHASTVRHLERIDSTLARIAAAVRKSHAVLCVTADHGLVDTPEPACVDLRDVPGLYACFPVLPAGDARQVACLVRPSRERDFLRLAGEHLDRFCVCVPGAELIARGVYGGGAAHPSLSNRVGDYVLLARPGCALTASPMTDGEPRFQKGNHGGMSREEMRVPLFVVEGRRAGAQP